MDFPKNHFLTREGARKSWQRESKAHKSYVALKIDWPVADDELVQGNEMLMESLDKVRDELKKVYTVIAHLKNTDDSLSVGIPETLENHRSNAENQLAEIYMKAKRNKEEVCDVAECQERIEANSQLLTEAAQARRALLKEQRRDQGDTPDIELQ